MRMLLAGLLTALGLSTATAATIDDLYAALETSDTDEVTSFVTEYYRDAGISVNETLTWEHQAFDEIVNWYNQHTEVIMLSNLPANAEEVAAYWQNWSKVLTQETWDWRSFFADEAEAALVANFNQFLLAAHEYGHALTYRYDPEHERRADYAINCREYPADRLAAALLDELAEKDQRIAGLRSRYRALIDEINAHIAPEFRYVTPRFADLDANCALLHVEQPTDDPLSMTPYASAFFVRHGLLQAEDLPPLGEIYETHLLPYWRAAQLPPSGLAGAVTTGEPFDLPAGEPDIGLPEGSRHLAYDPSGAPYVVEAGYSTEGESVRVAFRYGPHGEPGELVLPPTVLPDVQLGAFGFFGFTGAVAFGPDRFLVSTSSMLGSVPALLFDVRRRAGVWSMRVIDLEPDPDVWENVTYTGIVFDPAGTPYALVLIGGEWRRMQLDPQTLATVATNTFTYPFSTGLAVGPQGETYLADEHRIVVIDADGQARTFAGNGLQGFKDNADPLEAEFARGSFEGWLGPDGLRIVDYDVHAKRTVLRHIAWAR
jgi:hypothetical protein